MISGVMNDLGSAGFPSQLSLVTPPGFLSRAGGRERWHCGSQAEARKKRGETRCKSSAGKKTGKHFGSSRFRVAKNSFFYGKAKLKMSLPAAIATCCLPRTA